MSQFKRVAIVALMDGDKSFLGHFDPQKRALVLPSVKINPAEDPHQKVVAMLTEKAYGEFSIPVKPLATFYFSDGEEETIECILFQKELYVSSSTPQNIFITDRDKWIPGDEVAEHIRLKNEPSGFTYEELPLSPLYAKAINLCVHNLG